LVGPVVRFVLLNISPLVGPVVRLNNGKTQSSSHVLTPPNI
jgi:hypothetical protein